MSLTIPLVTVTTIGLAVLGAGRRTLPLTYPLRPMAAVLDLGVAEMSVNAHATMTVTTPSTPVVVVAPDPVLLPSAASPLPLSATKTWNATSKPRLVPWISHSSIRSCRS